VAWTGFFPERSEVTCLLYEDLHGWIPLLDEPCLLHQQLLYKIAITLTLYEFDHYGHAHVNHDGEKEATAYYFDYSKKYNIHSIPSFVCLSGKVLVAILSFH
jgi:hypothetical protein